jgi:hypothetical protein
LSFQLDRGASASVTIDAASPTRGISRRAEHPGFACVSEGRSVKNAANRFSRR